MPTEYVQPTSLSVDEQKALVGELKPGQTGHISLSETGEPVGAAAKIPPTDALSAPVLVQVSPEKDVLTTPSGAPITQSMNPGHSYFDRNLSDRYPTEQSTEPLEVNAGETPSRTYAIDDPESNPPPPAEVTPKEEQPSPAA
jgi:hypothetical protein